ncbi:MAG: hypothetical protein Q9222_003834 [Ikaeria aurantiellina]
MAASDSRPSIVVGSIALGFVGLFTVPSLIGRIARARFHATNDCEDTPKLYEDEDGVATAASEKSFSNALPIYLLVVADLFRERRPIKRFNDALTLATSNLILLLYHSWQYFLSHSEPTRRQGRTLHLVLFVLDLGCVSAACLICLLLPRRPSVFSDGQPVDAQFTASALSRWTFAWCDELLSFAKKNGRLDLGHLPRLHLRIRSKYLEQLLSARKQSGSLWKDLIRFHRLELFKQSLLAMSQGVIQFTPQIAMYRLLELLEKRHAGQAVAREAWVWVFGLGLSIILSSWTEAFLHWVTWARMGSPIRSELSALIFSKATRRKDVKGHQKAEIKNSARSDGPMEPALDSPSAPDNDKSASRTVQDSTAEEEGGEVQKSRQSVINLIGIDTKRIADFALYHWIFSQTVAKLVASTVFLVKLIGWPSLLAGFAISALTLPFNVWASRTYSQAQTGLMKARDHKMVVITEALQGIRQIKFSALEMQWQLRIRDKRAAELVMQYRAFVADVGIISIWILNPVMLSAVSLAVFTLLSGDLSASIAFTTITIFAQIEMTLSIIPELTSDALEAWVSLKRIGEYLKAPEKEEQRVPAEEIAFEDVSVAWPADNQDEDPDRFILRSVNLRFPSKELSIISGKTGSGKSLLLAAILGEADKINGVIKVPLAPAIRYDHRANSSNWYLDSAVAFVAQIPWIENATIRDNILFGLPFDQVRYNKVLSSCALTKDLEMLPDGELTDIGANGAVDAQVGRQLFEEALTGELGKGRTRILVTHHVALCLPKATYTVSLADGTVEHTGYVKDPQSKDILDQMLSEERDADAEQSSRVNKMKQAKASTETDDNSLTKILTAVTEQSVRTDDSEIDVEGKVQPKKFTENEKRERGSVKFNIWKEYLSSSGGWFFWPPILLFFVFYQSLVLGRSWWISIWTRSYQNASVFLQQSLYRQQHHLDSTVSGVRANQLNSELAYYLGIYFGISLFICLCGTWRYYFVFMASLKASQRLFERLTHAVLRAPLRWLDTVPLGRVLNRFTADFAVVDSKMGTDMGFMLYQVIQLIGIVIAGLFVSPYMLLFSVVLLMLCMLVARRFLAGARETKRLESNAKSPIFEQFGSALAGIGTIRAFAKADAYMDLMFEKIDAHARTFWHIWLFNRWMAFRLNVIGAFFAILVAAVIVSSDNIDASLAGFALSFALQYSGAITWTIRQYTSVELAMNAMERIVEYSEIPTEKQEGSHVPAAWPTEGNLDIKDLVAGYAPDLPPVLKGLSFSVAKNQRIGVVGRTGAGKSSLTLALFRFLEAREGSVVIDGIDISQISLHDLRSRLAIIPQDPVLFSGTVRSNLDAFDEHDDAELFDALERVHLMRRTGNVSRGESSASPIGSADGSSTLNFQDTNTNIFSSLSSRISEGGLNLSQGQRQLLCLARAIVSRPKIMVLDEATSAVDMATDVLIQRSIREEFGDSTLLVIAHRLATIADFDRILVMSDGKAVECDTPRNLLATRGHFWEMVEQSGDRDRLEEIILGVDVGVAEGRA